MAQSTLDRAKAWASNPAFDEDSRKEIQALIDNNDQKEIEERFYRDLEFGTGGMRAILGQGTYRLNKYNIRKATHAVSKSVLAGNPTNPKVAISYDSRKFSFEFAKSAAEVFAANGIQALIYEFLNPVPLCSFAIRYNGCSAGVMVTASHNPPEYNGFKVFWADGAQVTPPNDKNIIKEFNDITDYASIPVMPFEEGESKGLIKWIGEETRQHYFNAIKENSLGLEECQKYGKELKVVYTALHGTGWEPCSRALTDIGLTNIYSVKEQQEPDETFHTVSSPNPENPEALELAVKLMEKEGADIAMGTDPDTDRVGVALFHNGKVEYINGNQIGILMLHYTCSQYEAQGKMPKKPYFVKTIVTTDLQTRIAKKYGVEVENTLTGFKWICGRVEEIDKEDPERTFIFGTEESFGYLNHRNVRDKDGVSSVALMAEIALHYKRKGKNLIEALDDIYEEFAFSHERLLSLNYYGKEGAEKIQRIMDSFRNYEGKDICGQGIDTLSDFKNDTIKNFKTGESTRLGSLSSNVLGFQFENGNKLFLRPSGTEPKIKFYIMIQAQDGTLEDKKAQSYELAETFVNFITEWSERT
ncbi:MAG: phospho-sugar mutase [Halobacteriovoraceae bacterium]|nr:phospho-sugar mutase [Halobacteriovoraceae bacterium]